MGRIEYDSSGYVTGIFDDLGRGKMFSYQWDENARVYYARVETTSGSVTEKWFDRYGQLTEERLNGEILSEIQTDGRNQIIYGANGSIEQLVHDDRGNVIKEILPDGKIRTYQYHPRFNKISRKVDAEGLQTDYTYDENGNLIKTVEADGTPLSREETYVYNEDGQLIEYINAIGTRLAYEYNEIGLVTREFDPDNPPQQVLYRYDERGFMTEMVDPMGESSFFEFDDAKRPTKEINALGVETLYTYQGENLVEVEEGRTSTGPGRITRYTYDSSNQLLETYRVDENGNEQLQLRNHYDAAGFILAREDALGNRMEYVRDPEDRILRESVPYSGGVSVSSFEYDERGNMVAKIDPAGVRSEMEYDYAGRLVRSTDGVGSDIERTRLYEYDGEGRQTKVTYLDGGEPVVASYDYDLFGRVLSVSGNGVHPVQYEYNPSNLVTASIDANGHRTEFVYDKYDRLFSRNQKRLLEPSWFRHHPANARLDRFAP